MSAKDLRVLAIVATDNTFEKQVLDGQRVWVGKCIHCNKKLVIADSGVPLGNATIEHIWPRTRGGGNDLENIALACAGCNREKGKRHDRKAATESRLDAIVEELRRRRTARWREPVDELRVRVEKLR